MTHMEAIELLEEVSLMDDSMYAYSDAYCKALNMAIEAMKTQEPVKPVFERQFMSSIKIYDCGKCGTSLGAKGIAKYCMACGQAVKWDD